MIRRHSEQTNRRIKYSFRQIRPEVLEQTSHVDANFFFTKRVDVPHCNSLLQFRTNSPQLSEAVFQYHRPSNPNDKATCAFRLMAPSIVLNVWIFHDGTEKAEQELEHHTKSGKFD